MRKNSPCQRDFSCIRTKKQREFQLQQESSTRLLKKQWNILIFKMVYVTCGNSSETAFVNETISTHNNCSNGSANDNFPNLQFVPYELFASTTRIVAFSVVCSFLSLIALTGIISFHTNINGGRGLK